MTLTTAARAFLRSADEAAAALDGMGRGMQHIRQVLDAPAVDLRLGRFAPTAAALGLSTAAPFDPRLPAVDPRTGMFATTDPRARFGRAAAAQIARPDARAGMFVAGPNDPRRGVSEVPLTDPRLASLVAFAQMTWLQILTARAPGRSHIGKNAAPIAIRSRFVKPGGFFSERE